MSSQLTVYYSYTVETELKRTTLFFNIKRNISRTDSGDKLFEKLLAYPFFKLVNEYCFEINKRAARDFERGINTSTGPLYDILEKNTHKFIKDNEIDNVQNMTDAELTLFKLVVLK